MVLPFLAALAGAAALSGASALASKAGSSIGESIFGSSSPSITSTGSGTGTSFNPVNVGANMINPVQNNQSGLNNQNDFLAKLLQNALNNKKNSYPVVNTSNYLGVLDNTKPSYLGGINPFGGGQ